MVKKLVLFLITVLFMYLTFAANHYFDTHWVAMPTMILTAFLSALNACYLIANLLSKNKDDK